MTDENDETEDNIAENIDVDMEEPDEQEQPTVDLEIPVSYHHESIIDSMRQRGAEDEVMEQLQMMLQPEVEEAIHNLFQSARYQRQ